MGKSRGSRRAQRSRQARPLNFDALGAMPRSERDASQQDVQVQRVRGGPKAYTCPGCLHEVRPYAAHVVVWPEEAAFGHSQGIEARRHWHGECWRRRLRPQQ